MKELVVALRAALVTLVITGIVYPLVVWGGAQAAFRAQANGSIVTDEHGQEVGAAWIGQGFTNPGYLQARPSATGYDAANSGGTNLGPTSKKLRDGQPGVDESFAGVVQLDADYRARNGLGPEVVVPPDAITRSASGIDPDISPENARLQAARIAKARGVELARVMAVIDDHTDGRQLGVLGEPRVNVLATNLALDRKFGRQVKRVTVGP